ncbi:MAG: hypothetical protein HY606_11040 [Planctomycetes bacterium]|nr:hypothetical protein [Planctomycetota bacterium]
MGELEEIKIPKNIKLNELAECFSQYIENDYYDWLKDNFKSFFNYGNPDWEWVKERIKSTVMQNA